MKNPPNTAAENLAILQEVANRRSVDAPTLNTLQHIMHVESSGGTRNRNPSSSATGAFQFLDSTWLGVIKMHGQSEALRAYGLEKYVDKIHMVTQSDGKKFWTIDDPKLRQEALDLRYNVEISSEMVVIFTRENQKQLESKLQRKVSSGELYLAHFLGAGGALQILTHPDPDAKIASILPAGTIDANAYNPRTGKRGVSFKKAGREIDFRDFTVADIQRWAANKMDQELSYEQLSEQNRQASWRRRHPRQLKPGEKDDYSDMEESKGDLIPSILQAIGQLIAFCLEGIQTIIGSIITACTGKPLESPATPRQTAQEAVPARS